MEHFTSVSPFWANSHCKEQQQPRTAGRQQASRATTTGAASRSTQEGTTNCVMTASLRAFDGGLCDGVGPSCHGLVINLLGFLITLLDAAQTWCSWLFLFSLCSWSSQGQTWMCPCFFENQCGRFPGNLMLSNYYICWIGAGFIAWKGLLERIFSWSRKQRLERQKVEENGNFECKGTKQLGSKLFQQVWVSQGEFNIKHFLVPRLRLSLCHIAGIATILLPSVGGN